MLGTDSLRVGFFWAGTVGTALGSASLVYLSRASKHRSRLQRCVSKQSHAKYLLIIRVVLAAAAVLAAACGPWLACGCDHAAASVFVDSAVLSIAWCGILWSIGRNFRQGIGTHPISRRALLLASTLSFARLAMEIADLDTRAPALRTIVTFCGLSALTFLELIADHGARGNVCAVSFSWLCGLRFVGCITSTAGVAGLTTWLFVAESSIQQWSLAQLMFPLMLMDWFALVGCLCCQLHVHAATHSEARNSEVFAALQEQSFYEIMQQERSCTYNALNEASASASTLAVHDDHSFTALGSVSHTSYGAFQGNRMDQSQACGEANLAHSNTGNPLSQPLFIQMATGWGLYTLLFGGPGGIASKILLAASVDSRSSGVLASRAAICTPLMVQLLISGFILGLFCFRTQYRRHHNYAQIAVGTLSVVFVSLAAVSIPLSIALQPGIAWSLVLVPGWLAAVALLAVLLGLGYFNILPLMSSPSAMGDYSTGSSFHDESASFSVDNELTHRSCAAFRRQAPFSPINIAILQYVSVVWFAAQLAAEIDAGLRWHIAARHRVVGGTIEYRWLVLPILLSEAIGLVYAAALCLVAWRGSKQAPAPLWCRVFVGCSLAGRLDNSTGIQNEERSEQALSGGWSMQPDAMVQPGQTPSHARSTLSPLNGACDEGRVLSLLPSRPPMLKDLSHGDRVDRQRRLHRHMKSLSLQRLGLWTMEDVLAFLEVKAGLPEYCIHVWLVVHHLLEQAQRRQEPLPENPASLLRLEGLSSSSLHKIWRIRNAAHKRRILRALGRVESTQTRYWREEMCTSDASSADDVTAAIVSSTGPSAQLGTTQIPGAAEQDHASNGSSGASGPPATGQSDSDMMLSAAASQLAAETPSKPHHVTNTLCIKPFAEQSDLTSFEFQQLVALQEGASSFPESVIDWLTPHLVAFLCDRLQLEYRKQSHIRYIRRLLLSELRPRHLLKNRVMGQQTILGSPTSHQVAYKLQAGAAEMVVEAFQMSSPEKRDALESQVLAALHELADCANAV